MFLDKKVSPFVISFIKTIRQKEIIAENLFHVIISKSSAVAMTMTKKSLYKILKQSSKKKVDD